MMDPYQKPIILQCYVSFQIGNDIELFPWESLQTSYPIDDQTLYYIILYKIISYYNYIMIILEI